jgi:hypothetical protein
VVDETLFFFAKAIAVELPSLTQSATFCQDVCVYTVITNGSVLYTRMYNSYEAGGPSMCCVRWSNEAATVHADITADHRDVPAFD